jgi:hypothetical protein
VDEEAIARAEPKKKKEEERKNVGVFESSAH